MTASQALRKVGVRSTHFYAASLGSVGLCVGLWSRAKTVDQDERGNAERRALFVGLWPPMFWLLGDSLKDAELVREQLLGRVDESAALDELPRLEINYDPARAPEAGSKVVEGNWPRHAARGAFLLALLRRRPDHRRDRRRTRHRRRPSARMGWCYQTLEVIWSKAGSATR